MKIKMFCVSVENIKYFLSGKKMTIQTDNPIPEDAELVRIYVEERISTPDKIFLFYTSESFPDLTPGYPMNQEKIYLTEYHGEQNAESS